MAETGIKPIYYVIEAAGYGASVLGCYRRKDVWDKRFAVYKSWFEMQINEMRHASVPR